MGRSLEEYVALALLREGEIDEGFYTRSRRVDFSGDFDQLHVLASEKCGFVVSEQVLYGAVRVLADWNLVRVSDDPYSGTFYKIWASRLPKALEDAKGELATAEANGTELADLYTRRSDYPLAWSFKEHEVFEDYDDHGDAWLQRALTGLKHRVDAADFDLDARFGELIGNNEIPASDRIVRLSDNQIEELDVATSELIEAVAGRNEVGSRDGLRELILGQLKAGRELFRSGCVRVHLVSVAMIEMLKFLAARYERETIGALASALLTALLNHFGIS